MAAVENRSKETIRTLFKKQQAFFDSGATRQVAIRAHHLAKLHGAIRRHEADIYAALAADMHKSPTESYFSELHASLGEIAFARKKLRSWTKPTRIPSPPFFPLSKGYVAAEPYGVALIMTPFNYPFSINFTLLAGAIAAGNCVIIKPSDKPSHSITVLDTIVRETFDEQQVSVVLADPDATADLLSLPFGCVYFIGSSPVGRIVMEAAAKNLTPVSLGLGGKCPAIVDASASIDAAARRIVWGKFLNNGQVCVGIDYCLVHASVKEALVERLKFYLHKFYGTDPKASADYGRIIDTKQFDRVISFLNQGRVLMGGAHDRSDLYLEPTVLGDVSPESPVAREEIFGPILPLFEFDTTAQALTHIRALPPPLGLYIFSNDTTFQSTIMNGAPSGSVSINDAVIQVSSPYTPQGGVGESGFGRAHGKYTFDAFSYKRMVLRRGTFFDAYGRFPPYRESMRRVVEKLLR